MVQGKETAKRQIKASSWTLAWILVCGTVLALWLSHSSYEAHSRVVAVVTLFGASVVLVDIVSTAYAFGMVSLDSLPGGQRT